MASIISDKNKFILETSQRVLHALITISPRQHARDPKALAKDARKYAIALWQAMRHPVE